MKAVLDACVLYPTVLREVLLGCAHEGLYQPIWSARLLEEWRRAAERNGGPTDGALADHEAAEANRRFPKALMPPGDEAALWLPDPADIHVLASAVSSNAECIVTLNLKDFPRREVSGQGVRVMHPDAQLMEWWLDAPDRLESVVQNVQTRAATLGIDLPRRALLKRARLPRLGKALG
ncbi:PIN domain-containing protein [Gymnodinialimonas sp. 2305UL16-5]|uniref:RSP_2648 family PIN domain-containing protein n=1 Tax=Gymnodinialimonas mytili TaxID=3126503 RepID=UPI00309AF8BE